MPLVVTVVVGYLIGSIPVAELVARRSGIALRSAGDRNPGWWNAKALLGRRAAVPVFIGDVAKGALAAGIGRVLGDEWWVGYAGAAAAMIGHAWPLFAGFRGGRSVLTFVGSVIVLSPPAAALAVAACCCTWIVTRRFDVAARVGVFGFPVAQAALEPRAHVAATGALMSIIGLRFAMAALAARATPATRQPAAPEDQG